MKKIFLCGLLCLCSVLMVGCGCTKENKEKDKVEEGELNGHFFENQMVDTLEIQNFNIAVEDSESFISFDVKNTLDSPATVNYIKIYLYDATDYLVLETYGYVGGTLEASATEHIMVDVDIDLSKVTRVQYEKM